MATQEEIDGVKDKLGPDAATNGYDDTRIGALLDAGASANTVARDYWESRFSATADFIDISESGSSRGLSAVTRNAKELASMYRDKVQLEEVPPIVPRRMIRSHIARRV